MDLESHRRWYDYSRARDAMLAATDTAMAPWYLVPSDDKKRSRLNCIADLLSRIPYEEIPYTPPKLPARQKAQGLSGTQAAAPVGCAALVGLLIDLGHCRQTDRRPSWFRFGESDRVLRSRSADG